MNLEDELEELSQLRSAGETLRNGLYEIVNEVEGVPVHLTNESPDQIASWLVNRCLGLMEELEEVKREQAGPFAVGTAVIASIKCEGRGSQSDYYQMRTRVVEAPTLDKRGSLVLKVDGYSDYISAGLVRVDLAQLRKDEEEQEKPWSNLVSLSANTSPL